MHCRVGALYSLHLLRISKKENHTYQYIGYFFVKLEIRILFHRREVKEGRVICSEGERAEMLAYIFQAEGGNLKLLLFKNKTDIRYCDFKI